jgi:ABC-type uncharacterized transport system permease subunit
MLFGAVAIISYAAATVALAQSLHADYLTSPLSGRQRLTILGLGCVGAFFHSLTLTGMWDSAGNVNFSFLSASSLTSLTIVALLMITTLIKPVDKLGVIVFPMASLIVLLKMTLPEETHILKKYSWQMELHILTSMLAYSLLNIAALQAILLAFQDWHLRTHHASRFVRSLPPLQTMEALLFQLIAAGFVLLSISLLSGFIFVKNLFAQHLAHKTVLSILAWIVFAVLLGGRAWQGWRGQVAIRWTLGGFISLMLAYFGSKMVLEWFLNRTWNG